MITLHDSIAPNLEPTRTQVGAWTEKTNIRGHNRLFGNERVLYSYRHENAPYRISLYLSDYDTINLRVRSRKKRPPDNAQETLARILGLLIAEQSIPLKTDEHDMLPDITTLEKPCFIKIRGQDSPIYFANIDFQLYEPHYTTPTLTPKTLDFSPAQDVKQWHINCAPVNPGFYALKKAIHIAGTQLHIPPKVIQRMIDTVTRVNTNVLNFMADLIEIQPSEEAELCHAIKQYMHYNKDSLYLIRVIERMILANRFDTAVMLTKIFERNDPQFNNAQTLANKALMADMPTPYNKEAHLKNLIIARLNIAMSTRDPNDAMLVLTAMNELAGDSGFLSLSQREDNNPLGSLLVQAALAIRESRTQAVNRITVPMITTTATSPSPLQSTSQIQASPPEPVSNTLLFSQKSYSNSNYSLINSNTQASIDSPTSHEAVYEASMHHPTRKRCNTV